MRPITEESEYKPESRNPFPPTSEEEEKGLAVKELSPPNVRMGVEMLLPRKSPKRNCHSATQPNLTFSFLLLFLAN